MDKKVKGAWLLHHSRKIQATTNQDFDSILFSGKCGTMLSALSGESQTTLTPIHVEALAKANQISPRAELPAILQELSKQRLIISGVDAIEVLGLTGHAVLEHTTQIFEESQHKNYENAVLEISEVASELPITESYAHELISDNFKLSNEVANTTLALGNRIGFFDSERISQSDKLLFNGNLFRREDAHKVSAVINSLKPNEASLIIELNQKLQSNGCLPLDTVHQMLTETLFKKVHSVGMYDVSNVGNEYGKNYFVTKPAAFSKFTNSIADDALDLAKALVASLTYGMTISHQGRGRIFAVSALVRKLIAGKSIGPATAIGNDYRALEFKNVVKVTPANGGMFTMILNKPEVGRLALAVIESGDITAETITVLPGAKVTEYTSPESNREIQRKESNEELKLHTRNLLHEIRTGGLSQ